MSTSSETRKVKTAGRKFYAETRAVGKPLEPTDANLAKTLQGNALSPHPRWFEHIRCFLAEEYGVTLSPRTIALEAAEDYADEIEGRNHDDATIARGEGIRAAVAQLRMPATVDVGLLRGQRDWLLSLRADTAAELGRMVKAGVRHFDGIVNLLDGMLDSAEGYAAPLEWVGKIDRRIHIVERATTDGDNLYAFQDEHRARDVAARYPGALVHEEILMNDSAAAQFLIDTAGEDLDPEEGSREAMQRRWIGRRVRRPDGREFTVTHIGEKDGGATVGDALLWEYVRNVVVLAEPDNLTELFEDYRVACRERDYGADFDTRCIARSQVGWLTAEFRRRGVWFFNGDYSDFGQIIPFIDAYWRIYEGLKTEGKYPYNSSFEGRIPGLENALPKEETPIYLLQTLRHLVEGHERLAEILEGGYRRLTELSEQQRFARVVVLNLHYALKEYEGARVIPDERQRPACVLPKGKRTHGRRLTSLDQVYVR